MIDNCSRIVFVGTADVVQSSKPISRITRPKGHGDMGLCRGYTKANEQNFLDDIQYHTIVQLCHVLPVQVIDLTQGILGMRYNSTW